LLYNRYDTSFNELLFIENRTYNRHCMGIHYLNNAEFPVLVCGGIIIFYVSAEYCPYPPCENALEGRNCEISPSIVGEGGG
jgi:hypothetical protein